MKMDRRLVERVSVLSESHRIVLLTTDPLIINKFHMSFCNQEVGMSSKFSHS